MSDEPEELTGLPFDRECLHCVIAADVQRSLRKHGLETTIGHLTQCIAEVIASASPNIERDLGRTILTLGRTTWDYLETLRKAGKRS